MRVISYVFFVGLMLSAFSCRKGCTDETARNYDFDAQRDDGSCTVGGCTDFNALNYSPAAQQNDGTCLYVSEVIFLSQKQIDQNQYIEVNWTGYYAGLLKNTCSDEGLNCETGCQKVRIGNLEPGTYSYTLVLMPQEDTLQNGAISIGATQCKIITVQ